MQGTQSTATIPSNKSCLAAVLLEWRAAAKHTRLHSGLAVSLLRSVQHAARATSARKAIMAKGRRLVRRAVVGWILLAASGPINAARVGNRITRKEAGDRIASESRAQPAHIPPMGWNSWYAFGWAGTNESTIRETADALVSTGLAAAGYR